MIVYNHDPDVVRWGLHTLIDCTLSNSGSYNSITQYQTDASQVGYVSEGYGEPVYENNVENDAVIAHTFQEELSRVAAAESSGLQNPGQELVVSQDWLGRPTRYHGSENGNNQSDQRFVGDHSKSKIDADVCRKEQSAEPSKEKKEESVEVPISVSSPSSEETSVGMEELSHFLDITDESAIDGEMGKRLHQMVPVPHVPKINGAIPSEDEEISDHQRLLDRLDLYELVENKVQGDGNCQFRALSDQLYRSPEYHKFVREQVVNQLKSHPQLYEGYVPMAFGTYLKNMSKTGEWGDHVTLQAAADTYGVKIFVLTSFKDTCYIEILPQVEKSKRVIFLSFWAEVHYNSIYPKGELPLVETQKKRRWWILGNW